MSDDFQKLLHAAREWKEANEWAQKNPEKMLKSGMTTEEAANVMKHYFNKEKALFELVDALSDR